MPISEQMQQLLEEKFHHSTFRDGQAEIINSLASGNPTLAILPTGKGKSLCYQLTSYLLEGLVVIVSPLISLMEDQVIQLQKLGEKRVVAFNSNLSQEERSWLLQRLDAYKFLFLSPEMLQLQHVIAALRQVKIAFLVVDEAHCVSIWGNDFRPEYRQLDVVLQQLNQPLLLALTATATPRVIAEIKEVLFPETCSVYQQSVDRPNIRFFVQECEEKLEDLAGLIQKVEQPGIIYCATRKNVEALYQEFASRYAVGYYHGGLNASQRSQLQQQFSSGKLDWLIATNAFGMGINKADIRTIIHYDLPASLENYVQEIGRAGRDGKPSQAILLYQENDESIQHFFQQNLIQERQKFQAFMASENKNEQMLSPLQQKWYKESLQFENKTQMFQRMAEHEQEKSRQLAIMLQYIHETGCRRSFILDYFAEEAKENEKISACCDFHQAEMLLQPDGSEFSTELKEPLEWQDILIKLFKEKKKVSF